MEAIDRALAALDRYMERKARQTREVEERLRRHDAFNHRQIALLAHAIRHPGHRYTIRSHRTSHDVAYGTAHADLHALVKHGLLDRARRGKAWIFEPPRDLAARMERIG